MNPHLELLHSYPFEKLAKLKAQADTPPSELSHISLSIGEPKHAPPTAVVEELKRHLEKVANYSPTSGSIELRSAISHWACKRFSLSALDAASEVIPVNGTREAIFAFVQAAVDTQQGTTRVLIPNPFYQIYEGAIFLAGAEPVYLNCDATNNYLPDFDAVPEACWRECQILFLCSPGNPTGAVLRQDDFNKLIALADKYDFILACDECYSEVYFDKASPPVGLLQACANIGRHDYSRCVVFHSLSKRSNLPGLRSGFVAGDAKIIKQFLLYRTYHGCAMPFHVQKASIAAWSDETHVLKNRRLYREKFSRVLDILTDVLEVEMPDAGFYLWPKTPFSDESFTQQLFATQNVTVLPGSYLARNTPSGNPGNHRVRIALVASIDECVEGAHRIKNFIK